MCVCLCLSSFVLLYCIVKMFWMMSASLIVCVCLGMSNYAILLLLGGCKYMII